MLSLEKRIKVCADESLQARVSQALLESGKKAELPFVVAVLVLASAVDETTMDKKLGRAITDEEIVSFVGSLP